MITPGMIISDRYEIIEKVGSGGMADVYKAKCHRLNRYVAIKILKPEYSSDKNFVAKFRGEAQSAAGLSHPNIVNVYDVGDDNGLYYIVMELVEGITLKKFIERKGKLDVREAIGITIQIAQGMEAAHANHIIHRDIKPQNIIISRDGKVEVTDFGIAKAATSNTVTQTQNAIGSVHYLSPEQARGGYSDEKSDIYSLGVTMYEMLTGRVPFAGENTVSVALLHIQGEATPVRELNPNVPMSVEKIVHKCMQKKPERRYMSASELIVDLKRSLLDPDGTFVKINDQSSDSPTINMTDDEMNEIKSGTKPLVHIEDSEESAKPKKGLKRKNKIQDDEDDDDLDSHNSKLEKFLSVATVFVVIVLGIGVLYAIMSVVGVLENIGGGSGDITIPTRNPVATSSPTPTNSPTPTPDLVEMPKVVSLTIEDALNSLNTKSKNFDIRYKDDESETYEKGIVMDQYPVAGTDISKDSTITLTISNGKAKVKVPDVTSLVTLDAKEILTGKGFIVAVDYEESSVVEAGRVIRTVPASQEYAEYGSKVIVIVSKELVKTTAIVKNVSGLDYVTARAQLETLGFDVVRVDIASDTVDEDLVIYTNPTYGEELEYGSQVTVYVSSGKPEDMEVKEFRGMTETEAKAAIEAAGFTVGIISNAYSNEYAVDTICGQSYAAGTILPAGTVIDLYISVENMGDGDNPDDVQPVAELKYRGTLSIIDNPIPSGESREICVELTQGDTAINLVDDLLTSAQFTSTLSNFVIEIKESELPDGMSLIEGLAVITVYVDGFPQYTTYTTDLVAGY